MKLHTISLTDTQKEVLIRVYTAATPELAKAETEFGEKNIAAADILQHIEAISINEKGAFVEETGKELMRQQGLLDDEDNLTDEASQYSLGHEPNDDLELPDDDFSDVLNDVEFDLDEDL